MYHYIYMADLKALRSYVAELASVRALTLQVAAQEAEARALKERLIERRDQIARLKTERERSIQALWRDGVPRPGRMPDRSA